MNPNYDPLNTISLPTINLKDSLFDFLKKALMPETSLNLNPDRFDNALLESRINPKDDTKLNILDLGCGDSLILQKIFNNHVGPENHLDGSIDYLGIDAINPNHKSRELDTQIKSRCKDCFPRVNKFQFNLAQEEGLFDAIDKRKPYDIVILDFVLHELPPTKIANLLAKIYDVLKPNGELLIIDPDQEWCFSKKAWSSNDQWELAKLKVDWETDAIWLSPEGIKKFLSALGYDVNVHDYERSQMKMWFAISNQHKTNKLNTKKGKEALSEYLSNQLQINIGNISNHRNELRDLFRNSNNMTWDLFLKTIHFFAACASQSRRLEAISELEND